MTLDQIMIGLAAALALAFAGWYLLGAQWNVRHAHAGLRWLRDGLPLLGARTTMSWMGTTGVALVMKAANEPFTSVSLLLLMEPRDVIPLWLLAHARGRRDVMTFRGDLRRHGRVEFNLLEVNSRSGQEALKHGTPKEWSQTTLPGGLLLAAEGTEAAAAARQMLKNLGPLAQQVCRVSVRRTAPHIEVHMVTPWLSGMPSTQVFSEMKNAVRLLS